MEYCPNCESLMVPDGMEWICMECEHAIEREKPAGVTSSTESPSSTSSYSDSISTDLELLDTSDAGNVKKADAMNWMKRLDEPTAEDLKASMVPKPSDFSGSTFATDISNIRITGDPEFIETFAGLFKPILDLENPYTRVELNLQQIEDRDTDELTENYALYLSITERG